MLKYMFLLVLSFVTISCADLSTNYNEVELDKEFSIKVGESAIISSGGITINFKSVDEDSRCPIGLRCFWAGNAVVILELKDSDRNKQTTKLNTYLDPKNVEFDEIIIALRRLAPYPRSDESIKPGDYVVRLIAMNK